MCDTKTTTMRESVLLPFQREKVHLPQEKHLARRKQMGEAFEWGGGQALGVVSGVKDQLCLV